MKYTKQPFYDAFHCIADKCPASCCLFWQIMIDDETLKIYESLTSPIGNRIKNSIDYREGSFLQYDGRCAMLSDDMLCDIHRELSENYLCKTCKDYPRHVEEYDGMREYSLSLSCPEAARMILKSEDLILTTYEDDTNEEDPDFDDFDDLLFDELLSVRDDIFSLVRNKDITLDACMQQLMFYGKALQKKLFDDLFSMNEVMKIKVKLNPYQIEEAANDFSYLYELEFLSDDWKDALDKTSFYLKDKTGDFSLLFCDKDRDILCYARKILFFFLYTYFLGAVYDDCIYAKIALSVFCTRAILLLYKAHETPNLSDQKRFSLFLTLSYRFAREVEHSDLNLNHLEDVLDR